MLMPDREPDTLEKGVRFACGMIVAVPMGLYVVCDVTGEFTAGGTAVSIGGALIFALLAMRYGDEFWRIFLRLFTWL